MPSNRIAALFLAFIAFVTVAHAADKDATDNALNAATSADMQLLLTGAGSNGQGGAANPNFSLNFQGGTSYYSGLPYASPSSVPTYSFSRASAGYAFDSNGAMHSFASGALRQTTAGVLIEKSEKNLIEYSQSLTTSPWSNTNFVGVSGSTDPLGGTSAFTFTDNTTSGNHFLYQAVAVGNLPQGLPITVQVFLHQGSSGTPLTNAAIVANYGSAGFYCYVNMSALTATATPTQYNGALTCTSSSTERLDSYTITQIGSTGWYYITISGGLNGRPATLAINGCPNTGCTGVNGTYAGSGETLDVYQAGMVGDWEPTPSSPILNASTTLNTRAADALSYTVPTPNNCSATVTDPTTPVDVLGQDLAFGGNFGASSLGGWVGGQSYLQTAITDIYCLQTWTTGVSPGSTITLPSGTTAINIVYSDGTQQQLWLTQTPTNTYSGSPTPGGTYGGSYTIPSATTSCDGTITTSTCLNNTASIASITARSVPPSLVTSVTIPTNTFALATGNSTNYFYGDTYGYTWAADGNLYSLADDVSGGNTVGSTMTFGDTFVYGAPSTATTVMSLANAFPYWGVETQISTVDTASFKGTSTLAFDDVIYSIVCRNKYGTASTVQTSFGCQMLTATPGTSATSFTPLPPSAVSATNVTFSGTSMTVTGSCVGATFGVTTPPMRLAFVGAVAGSSLNGTTAPQITGGTTGCAGTYTVSPSQTASGTLTVTATNDAPYTTPNMGNIGFPIFMQTGSKDYQNPDNVFNTNTYVYFYFNEGYWVGGYYNGTTWIGPGNLYLGRCTLATLGNTTPTCSYWQGVGVTPGTGSTDYTLSSNWTSTLTSAVALFNNPGHMGPGLAQYLPGCGCIVLSTTWYPTYGVVTADTKTANSDFYTCSTPSICQTMGQTVTFGPTTYFNAQGIYQFSIIPSTIANDNGRNATWMASGDYNQVGVTGMYNPLSGNVRFNW